MVLKRFPKAEPAEEHEMLQLKLEQKETTVWKDS